MEYTITPAMLIGGPAVPTVSESLWFELNQHPAKSRYENGYDNNIDSDGDKNSAETLLTLIDHISERLIRAKALA